MTAYPAVAGPDAARDPQLDALLAQLRARHHDAICCALVYGSCLRSGDIYDGLLDLYLICDSYRAAYQRRLPAVANWMLPPNVFYAQQEALDDDPARTLRAKVTVISLRDFSAGCSTAWFESYIWGRFAQPTHILYARDDGARTTVERALLEAGYSLLHNALPALPPGGTLAALWDNALALSYSSELRTERSGRSGELARFSPDFYLQVTRHHAARLGGGFVLLERDDDTHYRYTASTARRSRASMAWGLRRAQGKLLSVARLVKAMFTFEGGLDYIAWKLERHSGQPIAIPDRVRRRPLIHLWGFFWGLYRRGIFR